MTVFSAQSLLDRIHTSRPSAVGVWGLGRSGTALVTFLQRTFPQHTIHVTDRTQTYVPEGCIWHDSVETFLSACEVIIPSPGVDLAAVPGAREQCLSELDLFQSVWHGPIVAITGSVGKTTVTTCVHQLLGKHTHAVLGGNIGISFWELPCTTSAGVTALLECSSFQLEHTHLFTPTIAVVTNLHANHLDRHGSLMSYKAAKARLWQRHTAQHMLCMSAQAASVYIDECAHYPGTLYYITDTLSVASAPPQAHVIYAHETGITYLPDIHAQLGHARQATFPINWGLAVCAAHCAGYPLEALTTDTESLALPGHRCACLLNTPHVAVYNDSKATVMESTQAACIRIAERHPGWHVVLLLGGTSKGVDRASAIGTLKDYVARIVCFGSEAASLYEMCLTHGIAVQHHQTLCDAVESICKNLTAHTVILFSPGGASYDAYANYEARGTHFVHLIQERMQTLMTLAGPTHEHHTPTNVMSEQ